MSFALPVTREPTEPPRSLNGQLTEPSVKRGIRLAPLRAPLVVKLVGANLIVVVALAAAWILLGHAITAPLIALVLAVLGVQLALVLIALRPIRDLELAASRVWSGDHAARVKQSVVADQGALRVGSMFNLLLDNLAADRTRMRALASEVIAAGDVERAAVARELHDSTAQRLAALLLQLSAAARDCKDPALAVRLIAARDTAHQLTEEVRLLSESLYSTVLDDLGLTAALQKLAREATAGTGIDIDVDASGIDGPLPRKLTAALYRVAQEGVHNAVRHASPKRIHIVLQGDGRLARLEVSDDGIGFEPVVVDPSHSDLRNGLAAMRERVALADGVFEVKSARGGGTTIIATIPLTTTA